MANPGFPRWGWWGQPKLGAPTYYLNKCFQKTAWKWKQIGPGASLVSLLWSDNACLYDINDIQKNGRIWSITQIRKYNLNTKNLCNDSKELWRVNQLCMYMICLGELLYRTIWNINCQQCSPSLRRQRRNPAATAHIHLQVSIYFSYPSLMATFFKKEIDWYPCFVDFWRHLPWVSKPGWIPLLHASSPVCNRFLKYTPGATPADTLDGQHGNQLHSQHAYSSGWKGFGHRFLWLVPHGNSEFSDFVSFLWLRMNFTVRNIKCMNFQTVWRQMS